MKNSIRYTIPLCLLLASTAMASNLINTHNAYNNHAGFYVGVGAGTNIYYAALLSSDNNNATAGFNGFSWNTNAGYSFTTTTAVEAGFIQGNVNTSNDLDIKGKATVNIPYLTARFTIPIGQRFSFIAKTGLMFPAFTEKAQSGDKSEKASTSHYTLPFVGVGASYAITHHITVDITFQGAVYAMASAGAMSGGVTYNF